MSDDLPPRQTRKKPTLPLAVAPPPAAKPVPAKPRPRGKGVLLPDGKIALELPAGETFKSIALAEAQEVATAFKTDPFLKQLVADFGISPEEMDACNQGHIEKIKQLPDHD